MKKLGLLLALLLALPIAMRAQGTSWETATELAPGETFKMEDVKATGSSGGYFWKITLTESGTISLKVKQSNAAVFLYAQTHLYYMNEDGTREFVEHFSGSKTITHENAKPGTYCVWMYCLGKLNSYSLTYTFTEPGEMVDRKFLVVETKDHVQTTYMLEEKLNVQFVGTDLRVVSQSVDVTYKLSDILRFTYETKSVTGISELCDEQAAIDYSDGQLIVSGIKQGASVSIYSMDGKMVQQLQAGHSGTYRISLSSLPQGVYIVKADNITYKIMKR